MVALLDHYISPHQTTHIQESIDDKYIKMRTLFLTHPYGLHFIVFALYFTNMKYISTEFYITIHGGMYKSLLLIYVMQH